MRTLLILLVAVPAMAVPVKAVIVDRIAITVGNQVITDSEIDQRIRLTAFENGDQPDFSPASRKLAALRLIDEKLVEHEMSIGRYPGIPDSRKPELLAAYEKEYGAARLETELAARGLTKTELMNDLARQQNLLTFLKLRFRPAVQISEQDIRKYYAAHYATSQVPLNTVRALIEQKLTDDDADVELDAWLKSQRERTRIEYLEKDLAQ
jgi:parvulin-like peptidyl-prolyl isomerase